MTGKSCAKKHKGLENALNVTRRPKSEELFNAGRQPSIPTRGLSSILSDKPERKTFKISIRELKENRFRHE